MARIHDVRVLDGLQEEFMRRHKRDLERAAHVWKALVASGVRLSGNPFLGTPIKKRRFPQSFKGRPNLWKLDLPDAFRALYSVGGRPGARIVIVVEWIGDHKAYDRLLGYD